LIKESELESEETLTFISVEVLQNIVDFIDINQLMSDLKEKAYQHFKFSGWRLTHISKKAVEYIPGFDITLYPHLTDQVQKSFNDENLLCEEEVPEIPACISNTLTEFSLSGDLFEDISTTGIEDVDSCIDMEKECMDLDDESTYGGTGAPFGVTSSNTVVSCHLDTQQFKKLVTQEGDGQPMALYGQAVVTDNKGLFYTVGGTSGFHYFMDVNMLDLRSSPPIWSSLYRLSGVRDEPEPR